MLGTPEAYGDKHYAHRVDVVEGVFCTDGSVTRWG